MSAIIAIAALLVSLCSLLFSFFSWKRSSRPIVTAAVQTHKSGNQAITYNLVILNSGTIPAKNVRIKAAPDSLEQALGTDATPEIRNVGSPALVGQFFFCSAGSRSGVHLVPPG